MARKKKRLVKTVMVVKRAKATKKVRKKGKAEAVKRICNLVPSKGTEKDWKYEDAVAAANILASKLAAGNLNDSALHAVQRRREFPTRATQRLQVIVQNKVIRRVLSSTQPLTLPWPLRMLQRWPLLRRIPARVIGMGFRPEHVPTPENARSRT